MSRRKSASIGLLLLCGAVGCRPQVIETYAYRPVAAAPLPALPARAPVRIVDLTVEEASYEQMRARLPANVVVGRFYAIHRRGGTQAELRPTIEALARAHGGDVVLVSCGPQVVDGETALVCAAMLLRTER